MAMARRTLLSSKNLYYNSSKYYSFSLNRGFASGSDEENDVVVIGGGPAGYVAAIKAAQLGLKTTCIDKRGTLGGTSVNVGSIPSKALLHSSHMYHEATHSFANHGLEFSSVEVDLPTMMAQKDRAVSDLTKGIEGLFKKNKVNYVKGYGKFLSPSEIKVDTIDGGETVVKGKNIIIATGSDVKGLPGITIDEDKIVSSTGALALKKIPKKLVVIGAGGYIGLEIGCIWGRLGSEVTVVEFAPQIVPSMDGEVRRQFQRTLEKQKMKFMLKTKVVSVDSSGDGVKLTLEPAAGGDQTVLEADVVLVSAGRTPFTAGLQLDKIGVETDKVGRILVNESFATTVPGVYAIGDVIPGPMLANKAMGDGVACVEFIAGKEVQLDYDMVPWVVFTHPEVASVGKTEEQVKALGVSYSVRKSPLVTNLSRAKAIYYAEGLLKILAEKETDKILGVHIMAPNAGDLIHEALKALQLGTSGEDLARAWF
ncbi:dihydrolipoyl dehydrogenase 1, mitochondrial-like [Ipomoea triloba]|uniref:dihydrolipoyl dehydrogenase 1, mitochondrial-like n=1 Tax=Ipomoea triloba TaxID=35885 RepID=UPI00125CFFD0|nr:dihydrolipoyl dehydrogenase 1, mitochondrial-like [Ipomoea triloba]